MRKLPLILLCLFALPVAAQTPQLVYSDSSAALGSDTGNAFKIIYGGSKGTGSLASNTLTLSMTAPHGSTISSIVDTFSDSWTLAASTDSGTQITAVYYLLSAPANITSITVNYSGAVSTWHYRLGEYSGVLSLDTTCNAHTTTPSCSLTTTAANDLVVSTMIASGAASLWVNNCSTLVPGGSAFLDAADTQSCDADEEQTVASAGAVTTSFTVTGTSQTINIVSVAFKSGTKGTNPTGMYLLHLQKVQQNASGTQNMYMVSSGNLSVVANELGTAYTTYAITSCTPTNTFTKRTPGSGTVSNFAPQMWYLPSTGTFSTNLHCTMTGGNSNNAHFAIYDFVGAATSPEDASSTGGQGTTTITDSITPTKGPGVIISAESDGSGPALNYTSSAGSAIFDNTRYTGETDTGQLNNGDGWGHTFYTSPAAITLTWSVTNNGGFVETGSIAFDAAPPPWNGIVANVRAPSPSGLLYPGVVGGNPTTGGLPSDSWPACATTACTSLATPANVTAANINTAIAGAPANTYIQLPAGSFTMSAALVWNHVSYVELRGQGANQTLLTFTGSPNTCQGTAGDVCIESSDTNYNGGPSNIANWTAGYAQSATSITLSSVTNLQVGWPITLDQLDDTTDSGDIYICLTEGTCSYAGTGGASRVGRSQSQMVTVTSITGTGPYTVGISPGLYMPNWNVCNNGGACTPQAWWATGPVFYDGVRNLSMDHTTSNPPNGLMIFNCQNCWVSGTRNIMSTTGASETHVRLFISNRETIQNNYFYQTAQSASVQYGIEVFPSSDTLIQNNICEKVQACTPVNGACPGCVVAYNFDVNNFFSPNTWLNQGQFLHSVDDHVLFEGNEGAGLYSDNSHGTHHFQTIFRSAMNGYQQNNATTTIQPLVPLLLDAFSRFYNVIGNVLGSPALPHTTYQNIEAVYANTEIYDIGWGDEVPNDSNVQRTLMRWGNYSIVTQSSDTPTNSGIRFVSSEVPSGITNYANPVPASQTLPASLYLTAKPSWWGSSIPYPAVGPDVTGGNLEICSAGVNKGSYATSGSQCPSGALLTIGGHANAIPALACYLNTMGGSPIGTDASALSFNASNCYAASGGGAAVSLGPNTITFSAQAVNSTSAAQTITLTNIGTATLNIASIALTGTNAANFGTLNSTCGATLGAGLNCTIQVTFSPLAVQSYSANLTFTTDAPSSPDNVTLTGTGALTGVVLGSGKIIGAGIVQ